MIADANVGLFSSSHFTTFPAAASVGDVAVGAAVGVAVGAAVGVAVGATVGVAVGAAVGVAVGAAVGVAVGAAVGVAVGTAVGVAVGGGVGVAVGGGGVGVAVGAGVGVTVGDGGSPKVQAANTPTASAVRKSAATSALPTGNRLGSHPLGMSPPLAVREGPVRVPAGIAPNPTAFFLAAIGRDEAGYGPGGPSPFSRPLKVAWRLVLTGRLLLAAT